MASSPELQPPVLLVEPVLPAVEGTVVPVTVTLLLLVSADGRVREVKPLTGPEPHRALAAERAMELVFSPAREGGVAVPVEVPFTWTLPPAPVETSIAIQLRTAGRGTPLAGVTVAVGPDLQHTDAEGRALVRNLSPGVTKVSIADPAWAGRTAEVDLQSGDAVEVELFATPLRLGEAVAIYSAQAPDPLVRRVSRSDLVSEPGAMGDPARAMQNLPGLVRTPLEAGWVLSRGGGPDDTQVFIDGVEVPLLFHLGGLTSVVHPDLVGALSYTPGLPAAERGNTLSGAAEVHTVAPESGVRAGGGLNLAFAHAFASQAGDDGSLWVGARRSYLDAVLAAALDDEASAIAPQFWDIALRGERGGTRALALAVFDRAVTPGETEDEPLNVSQGAGLVTVNSEVQRGQVKWSAQPSATMERRSLSTAIRDESLRSTGGGARLMATWGNPVAEWAAGIEGHGQSFDLVRNDAFRSARVGSLAPFLRTRGSIQTVEGEAQVRGETLFVSGQRPRYALSPRFRATWKTDVGLTISTELGRLVQQPDLLAAVAFPEGAYLGLETSRIAALAASWSTAKHAIRGAAWSRRFELAGYELDGTLGPLEGRATGIEASTSHQLGWFAARSIVQLTRSLRREEPDLPWLPSLYDQPLRLHLQCEAQLSRRWTLGARGRYASGFYNLRSTPTAFDLLTQTQAPLPAGRLPAFAALDLRVSKRWDTRHAQITAFVDLLHAAGSRVPEPAINGIDDAVVVYSYGLPFLPLFGVEGTWWRPEGAAQARQARDNATSSR